MKFFEHSDGQHYSDALQCKLCIQNEEAEKVGMSSIGISVWGMNVLHDFICEFGDTLTWTAAELMRKTGHKTLEARDMAFALDLLMEPGKLQIYTKFHGYKALKKTNTYLD